MTDINGSNWSPTDANNTAASPNGWPAGTFLNQVEPIGRMEMGAIKRWWERAGPAITTTGSANAYVYTPTNTSYPVAYVTGDIYSFITNFANTGTATLNVNGLGAKTIYKQTPSGPSALVGGELQSGQIVMVGYDGTQFELISPNSLMGKRGEINIVAGSAVSLTTGTPANLTSLSIPAGEGDIYGTIAFNADSTTVIANEVASISAVSATLSNLGNGSQVNLGNPGTGVFQIVNVGPFRVNLSAATTYYLVAQSAFTISTMAVYGNLRYRIAY